MAKIGDVCAFKIDTLSAAYNGKIDYIDISAVDNREKKITQTAIVLAKDAPSRAKQLVEHGDVIVSLVRPNLNAVAIIEEQSQNLQVASTGYCVLRCNQMIYNRYLFYFCQSETFVNSMTAQATGASYPAVSNSIVKNCEIPLPERNKQKEIADILDKVTGLISLRKQQLAKLDELIKARFVEMFGEPSSNPMGWLQTTVGAECYYIKDGPHKSLTDVGMGNGYPFISVRNIVNGYIDFSTAKYISEADYKDAIKKCCPEKGDILYSKGGTTGIAKLVDIDIKFANWVHLAVLKFNHNEFNGSFFEKMLNCDYCYKQSQMLTKGIANRDLVLSAMAQIKIYKPPILLQNQFATFVERVDQQKQTVQQSLEKLELMKKALMQEYFG